MKNKHVNAIVVGAGAGGGVAAKELATGGLSVVVFERGDWPVYDRHAHDELTSQRITVLGTAFGPDPERNPRVWIQADGNRTTVKAPGGHNTIASCVGSGTVSYGAQAWRFMPQDFQLKTIYGEIEGSSLEDWPFTYDDLEPYYEKAEWEIGVSGDETNPFAGRRNKPYPMPPFEYNREGQVIFDACKRLGLHPFPIPMLRNSTAYNGRAACIRNHACVGFACPVDAKNGTQNSVIPVAIRTGNCEVRTSCMVAEILFNDRGQATGVRYFDREKKLQTQTADIVIVAGAAIETARLLLNSKSKQHPNGAGNNNDQVGRNLQGHPYTGASGIFDYDVLDLMGPGATVAICDYNHGGKGLLGGGGGMLANEFFMLPYAFSRVRYGWGKSHKDFMRNTYHRLGRLLGPVQEIPAADARVTVDSSVKDYWGIPVAALSGSQHPMNVENAKYLSRKAEEILKEAGAIETWRLTGDDAKPGYGPGGGSHQAGTCRMGDDPRTSVVDANCRVHGIDNLFIADGSVHVTNGGFNPVLTIMANAFRTGDFIVKNFNEIKAKR